MCKHIWDILIYSPLTKGSGVFFLLATFSHPGVNKKPYIQRTKIRLQWTPNYWKTVKGWGQISHPFFKSQGHKPSFYCDETMFSLCNYKLKHDFFTSLCKRKYKTSQWYRYKFCYLPRRRTVCLKLYNWGHWLEKINLFWVCILQTSEFLPNPIIYI